MTNAIMTAPNAKILNGRLPEGIAVIRRGRGGEWAFTVFGNCRATGSFFDMRRKAATYLGED